MLNDESTIAKLQSSTVRAALIQVVIGVLTLLSVFTGHVFDLEAIKAAMDTWLPVIIGLATTWYGWKAYKGRISAEKKIDPATSILPWRKD